jgi:BRCT domain type II-containing protein
MLLVLKLCTDVAMYRLEQIEELNVKTMDEDELIAMLEAGGSSGKRGASDEDDDEEEEEEEKPKKKPTKKQKK